MRLLTVRRVATAALLVGGAVTAGLAASPSSAARPDAPFVALACGHVGMRYTDQVQDVFPAGAVKFQVVSGALPAGLTLDASTGTISGTPTAAGTAHLRISAQDASGQTQFARASLPIFTAQETEVVRGQSFETAGPATVTQVAGSFTWTSSFDQSQQSSDATIFVPQTPGKHPLLVFHYGRGFAYSDYPGFLSRIASWGIVVAAASDLGSFGGTNTYYDSQRAELGMESASSAQEALMDYVLGRSASSGDALSGTVDAEAVFLSGHSRGGGATHGSHVRSLSLKTRGVIYFMAFDLRYFAETVPPGTAPAFAIPTAQDRLPSLIISAGDDGDLVYPYADQLIDRATGPTTFVTVNGACHDFLSDNHASERTIFSGPIPAGDIARDVEQSIVASWTVAFIKRWATDDLSLEALLYEDEAASSPRYTVASWRRSSATILVDDFQDQDPATNLLRGANSAIGLTRTEETIYPTLGDFASLGIRHNVLRFTQPASSYATTLGPQGASVDGTGASFLARIAAPATVAGPWSFAGPQPGNGYQLGMWVKLHDSSGRDASVKVANEDGTTLGYLPGRSAPGAAMPPCDRFSTLSVPLARFQAANPALDLAHLTEVEFVFARDGSSPSIVALDDLRFEGGAGSAGTTTPPPVVTTVLAPSGSTKVTAESIATAYGSALATVTLAAPDSTQLGTALGGTTLTVTDASGVTRSALISYVAPGQVNFVVPAGTASGTGTVKVTSGSGTTTSGTVSVTGVAPGVFSADASGKGVAAANFVRVHKDGTQSFEDVARYDASTKTWSAVPVDVSTGEAVYLVLYATGLRGHAGAVSVAIGATSSTAVYAGPQTTYPGLDQVNVLVPASLSGQGTVSVLVTADGVAANAVAIAVK